jgi:hypothetical protein
MWGSGKRSHSLIFDIGSDQQLLHDTISFELSKNREAPMSLPVRFLFSVLLTVTLDGDKQIGSNTKSAHATHAHHLHHHGGGVQLHHDMLSPFLGYVQIIGSPFVFVNSKLQKFSFNP